MPEGVRARITWGDRIVWGDCPGTAEAPTPTAPSAASTSSTGGWWRDRMPRSSGVRGGTGLDWPKRSAPG